MKNSDITWTVDFSTVNYDAIEIGCVCGRRRRKQIETLFKRTGMPVKVHVRFNNSARSPHKHTINWISVNPDDVTRATILLAASNLKFIETEEEEDGRIS